MDIVVGTYEQLLLGYRLVKVEDDESKKRYTFEQVFTDNSHDGCVKAIAVSNRGVLASAGSDESIQLLNLKKRVEMGSLVQHEGAVTDLSFFNSSHLFSVSEDCTFCVWKCYTWECLRTFRGHKGPINSLAVHPSGRLALTVARDKTIRTWNLVTGRPAYITNIPQSGEFIRWSTNGNYYAVLYEKSIDVYETATASVCCQVSSKSKINTLTFYEDSVLIYCEELGAVKFHDIRSNSQMFTLSNGTKRIKSLVSTVCPDDPHVKWLICASSDGSIKVWHVDYMTKSSEQVAELQTGFRIICMATIIHNPLHKSSKEPVDHSPHNVATNHLDNNRQDNSDNTVRPEKYKFITSEDAKQKKSRAYREYRKSPTGSVDRKRQIRVLTPARRRYLSGRRFIINRLLMCEK